jgi:hypothetical protein
VSTVSIRVETPVPLCHLLAILQFAATVDDCAPVTSAFGEIVVTLEASEFAAAVEG